MADVVNTVMDVAHWSEGVVKVMVKFMSIERTKSNSKLSDPFLTIPVINSKHFFTFWTNSFQHFILEGGFENKASCRGVKAVPFLSG